MTAYLDDGDVKLYHGDAATVLAALPAASVQTCVTSPPYWGLRDYGTGEWTGGRDDCDHLAPLGGGTGATGLMQDGRSEAARNGNAERVVNDRRQQYAGECGKCGARRVDDQLGLETTPDQYVQRLVAVFREVRRVLRDDGTLWLNLGDSYANDTKWGGSSGGKHVEALHGATGIGRGKATTGLKPKDLVGIPWRAAFALQADGWYLRSDIIWSKPNPMPESVTDRPTKAHEYVFLLSKRPRYYYDADAIRERFARPLNPVPWEERSAAGAVGGRQVNQASGHRKIRGDEQGHDLGNSEAGRNARSVWEIATQPTPEAHFATFPEALARRCILAGSQPGSTILDPFIGSGTTALVARKHQRNAIGIDLSAEYLEIAARRLGQLSLLGGHR